MLEFVKDPSISDVHVDEPLSPGRDEEDILGEAEANSRPGGAGVKIIASAPTEKSFESFCKVAAVDEDHGLVLGWGMICRDHGQDYYDLQKNHIPESAMLAAVTEFMGGDREAGEQHVRMGAGTVVHSFPLTTDIAKAMGIETAKTGWMVAVKPDKAMLAKFRSGELTGFSIGGEHIEIDGKPVSVN